MKQQHAQQHDKQEAQQRHYQAPTLSADSVLNQFRQLKPYKGTEDFSLSSFIRSVEFTSRLCGENAELQTHGMQIVYNEKLQGQAEKCIRRLGNFPSWTSVKQELRQYFQPQKSYSELFNCCRQVKVINLRELFEVFRNISNEISELYEFDKKKPEIFKSENVDRDLVDILIEKIDGNIRAHIEEGASLTQIYNKYARLKMLNDERNIDINHKKSINHGNKNSTFKKNVPKYVLDRYRPNNTERNQFRHQNNTNQDRHQNDNTSNRENQSGSYLNSAQFRQNQFSNSGQFRQNQFNNSGQFRRNQFSNSAQFRRNQSDNYQIEHMEIGNIQENDVMFTTEPRKANCQ